MMRLTKKQMDYYTEEATIEANASWEASIAHSNLVIIELLHRILETQNNIDYKE